MARAAHTWAGTTLPSRPSRSCTNRASRRDDSPRRTKASQRDERAYSADFDEPEDVVEGHEDLRTTLDGADEPALDVPEGTGEAGGCRLLSLLRFGTLTCEPGRTNFCFLERGLGRTQRLRH